MSWFCLEKGQFLAHFCDTKLLRNSTNRNERELSWTSFSLAIASGFVIGPELIGLDCATFLL